MNATNAKNATNATNAINPINAMNHLETVPFAAEIAENKKIIFPPNSNIKRRFSALTGRLWSLWCVGMAGFFISVLGFPIVALSYIFGRKDKIYDWCFWGAEMWLKSCGARVKVSGLENLDAARSYIFISNHRSYLDTAVMFRHCGRRMGVIAKKELLKLPVAGYLMKNIDILTIDRSNAARAVETMQNATNIINKGVSLGIYAEGTRGLPGELLPFKKGAFHLALQTGAAIVPMVMKNSDQLLGKRTKYAQPGTLEVVFLKPIETKDFNEDELEKLRDTVRAQIAAELAKQ